MYIHNVTTVILHCFKLFITLYFSFAIFVNCQQRLGLFSYGQLQRRAHDAQKRTFHRRADLNSNSPSRFGFESLDSAQYNVFRNSLRIPWQPLPSSAFIYKIDKNDMNGINRRRLITDEDGNSLTTFQQVSATYRFAPVTTTTQSYANFQKSRFDDDDNSRSNKERIRQEFAIDAKNIKDVIRSDYPTNGFMCSGSMSSNLHQSASILNCFSRCV